MGSRRKFIKTGAVGAFVGLAGCINPEPSEDDPEENETDQNGTDEETDNGTDQNGTDEETDNGTDEDQTDEDETNGETEEGTVDVTATLGADGFSAWLIDSQEGGQVGDEGVNNPTLQLEEGTRYRFNNPVRNSHPLAFRNANGQDLLSQQGTGQFESDQNVEWVDEGDYVAFTVTSDLATELNEYYCTVHAQMVGDVQV